MILKTREKIQTVNLITQVFVICSGLGNVRRGYESFTQECFDALSQEAEVDVTLFKGGGETSQKEIALWNLPRNTKVSNILRKITEKLIGRGEEYFLEQVTFFLSLIPHLQKRTYERFS